MKRKLLIIAGLLFLVNTVYSQSQNVFTVNSTEGNAVSIKWFSKSFLYPQGVNIYRKTPQTDWLKINEQPFTIKPYSAAEEAANEEVEFLNAVLKEPNPDVFKEEMILIQFLLTSILDNDFAAHAGIYYTDENVVNGETYQYKISEITGQSEREIGISGEITSGEYKPDASLKELEAIQQDKKIAFNWLPEEDRFFGVNIYKSEDGGEEFKLNENPLVISQQEDSVGNLAYPTPMFKEDRLKQGKQYTYRVVGVDYFGFELESSQPIVVDFKDVTPPNPPLDFMGKADSMKVNFDWTYEELEFINGFRLYRSEKSDGPFIVVNTDLISKDLRQYQDRIETPGNYYYQLTSVDLNGNEGKSYPIYVEVQDVMPPKTPSGFMIQADSGLISLKWDNNTEPDLGGYFVFRTAGKNLKSHYTLLNGEPIKENYFLDTLAANVKSDFFYYIMSVDTSYNRSKQSELLSARMPDILAPQRPFLKSVKGKEEFIEIEWIKNADSDLMGYRLFKKAIETKTNEGEVKKPVKVNRGDIGGDSFLYRDRSSISENLPVSYYLVAYDSVGNTSVPSNTLTYYPKGKNVEKGDLKFTVKYNKRKKANLLTWQASSEESLMGYVLYVGKSEDKCRPYTGLMKESQFLDKLKQKEKKYYQVRAYYSDGKMITSQIK